MSNELEGRRTLITGAGRGLGQATAQLFAERGARVVLADIDGDAAERAAALIGGDAIGVACDVTRSADVQGAIARTTDAFGGMDVIVNNAGIEIAAPLPETDEADFDRLFDINVKGVFLGIKHATPALAAAGGGCIVNMSSVAGLGGVPLLGIYAASKAAVLRLTQTAAAELKPLGIRVNAVCPSFIDTEMVARLVNPFESATGAQFGDVVALKQGRLGTATEVAETCAFLASPDASFVTGSHFILDNALSGGIL